ncbi:hypothetical protein [Sphingomonas hengshuiensis]|nr:hypothetical protein [Sphingomonas hengshuiensis]
MSDIEEYGHAPEAQPVTATLAGCAILVVVAVAAPWLVPQQPLATLLAAGVAIGAAAWLVGLVVTVRHAAIGWKIGSLAILLVAGAAAALVAHGQYQTRARADASSFADAEFGPNGDPMPPAGAAGRGPLSRLYVDALQSDRADAAAFGKALAGVALGNLNSPYLLQQDPRPITDCAAIARIIPLAEEQAARRKASDAALRAAIAGASLSEDARRGVALMAIGAPGDDRVLANQRAMLESSSELCVLLARRGWVNAGGYFGFASAADGALFKALTARRIEIAAAMARDAREAAARREEGRDLVRTALERSIFLS